MAKPRGKGKKDKEMMEQILGLAEQLEAQKAAPSIPNTPQRQTNDQLTSPGNAPQELREFFSPEGKARRCETREDTICV